MILMTNKSTPASRLDEPLYTLKNETLYEKYGFSCRSGSLEKSTILGSIVNNIFQWDKDVINKNLLDRRGNFQNITIFAMTESDLTQVILPKDFKNVSTEFPNTYEVSTVLPRFLRSPRLARLPV